MTKRLRYACTLSQRLTWVGCLLLLLTTHLAHAQTWQTALAASRNYSSQVRAIATDASGNVFLAGDFRDQVTFGATVLTAVNAQLGGGQANTGDIFIAKWSPVTRGFVWAQRAGGNTDDGAYGLAVSGTSVYVTGYISSPTADFGSTTLTNRGSYDVFVTKLTDAGATSSFTWTQQAGGPSTDQAKAIAVSGSSVYITGAFAATASFGPTNLTYSSNNGGMFVAKLTDNGATGNFVWAQQADCQSAALAAQGASVYITGSFYSSTVRFGTTTLTNAGVVNGFYAPSNVFVAKLTDAGATSQFTWAKQAGGSGTNAADAAQAIAVQDNRVYITGNFAGATTTFGATTLANAQQQIDSRTGLRTLDMFVAQLTETGPSADFTWARRAGGLQDERVNGVAVSGNNVYVTGSVYSTAAGFGTTTLSNTSANTNLGDIFLAKLTEVGASTDFTWAQQAGGADYDVANAIAVYGPTVYVAGGITGTTTFGTITIPTDSGALSTFIASARDATGTALATTTASPLAGISVAPNPAHDQVRVQLPIGGNAAQATVTLRNSLGQCVRQRVVGLSTASQSYEVPVVGLAAGLYLVQVQVGATEAVCRLLVD